VLITSSVTYVIVSTRDLGKGAAKVRWTMVLATGWPGLMLGLYVLFWVALHVWYFIVRPIRDALRRRRRRREAELRGFEVVARSDEAGRIIDKT
jgi:hypothetical protein